LFASSADVSRYRDNWFGRQNVPDAVPPVAPLPDVAGEDDEEHEAVLRHVEGAAIPNHLASVRLPKIA